MFGLSSCESEAEIDLRFLTGYWEIEKVIFEDQTSKEYTFNTTVDYFGITDSTGYRKKLQPRLNGSFETSKDVKNFTIIEQPDAVLLEYASSTDTWKEKIIQLSADRLILQNSAGTNYIYKPSTLLINEP